MNIKPILIVAGEPNSIFFEIFFKSLKLKKYKSPLILVASYKLLLHQMKIFNFKKKIRLLNITNLNKHKLNNKYINLIDVKYNKAQIINKISKKSIPYIENSFQVAFKIIKLGITNKLINGPISKKNFLKKSYLGMTEYIADNFSVSNTAMLIYNKQLSVCPITTHLPLKFVAKKINKKIILKNINLINNFYKKKFNFTPRMGILGLNPHCESIDVFNEDEKILKPLIKKLSKSKYKISGPHPADTIFLKKKQKEF